MRPKSPPESPSPPAVLRLLDISWFTFTTLSFENGWLDRLSQCSTTRPNVERENEYKLARNENSKVHTDYLMTAVENVCAGISPWTAK